jgi:hypothetical protein
MFSSNSKRLFIYFIFFLIYRNRIFLRPPL